MNNCHYVSDREIPRSGHMRPISSFYRSLVICNRLLSSYKYTGDIHITTFQNNHVESQSYPSHLNTPVLPALILPQYSPCHTSNTSMIVCFRSHDDMPQTIIFLTVVASDPSRLHATRAAAADVRAGARRPALTRTTPSRPTPSRRVRSVRAASRS